MRAAEALRAVANDPATQASASHLDVMDFVPAGFRKLYTDFYIKLVNHTPTLWGYLYRVTNDAASDSTMSKLRRAVERLNTKALRKEITAFAPDAIICTHFLPAEVLSRMIGEGDLTCPVWVQVTDFDLHRMWVHDGIRGYFAANDEVAFRMRAAGVDANAIRVTGIPIMPQFAQRLDRATCAKEFAIHPSRTTFLLMGGGAGLGSLDAVAARLLNIPGDFQLIVLAGKNVEAFAKLQALAAAFPGRLLAQGFTDKVERLMACADLVVTKPGGLTTSECLAMGLPVIVNAPIPGQEERNADFLLEQGVALKACDESALEYRIRTLLEHPALLAEMRKKSKALGKPFAAREVLAHVLMNC